MAKSRQERRASRLLCACVSCLFSAKDQTARASPLKKYKVIVRQPQTGSRATLVGWCSRSSQSSGLIFLPAPLSRQRSPESYPSLHPTLKFLYFLVALVYHLTHIFSPHANGTPTVPHPCSVAPFQGSACTCYPWRTLTSYRLYSDSSLS